MLIKCIAYYDLRTVYSMFFYLVFILLVGLETLQLLLNGKMAFRNAHEVMDRNFTFLSDRCTRVSLLRALVNTYLVLS